jgi:CubicO group peptidase (beta-lactamase class C family)
MDLTPNPVAAGFDTERLARVDEHFQAAYVDKGKIAGYQIVVGRRGSVAHRSSGGTMDLETETPLDDQAIWRWYSMTKPVTAVALLSLVERAKVKLTDPVHRFLPEWRDVRVSVRNDDGSLELRDLDRPMLVKDALMHMTGIGPGPKQARLDMASLMGGDGAARPSDAPATLAELSRVLATEPLRFQPGTRWVYSWSTDICARLVEVIADQKFGDYLQHTVFDPLGMIDTGFHVPESAADRVTSLYARGGKDTRLVDDRARGRLCRPPTMQSGGGGLVGTIDDYARFCQMLTGGGALDGVRILGRPTVEMMRTNHLPGGGQLRDFAMPGGYGEVGFDGNGFGLQVAVGLGPAATAGVGPAGDCMWGGAASTAFWIDPIEYLYAIIMTQILPSGVYDIRGQLRSKDYAANVD